MKKQIFLFLITGMAPSAIGMDKKEFTLRELTALERMQEAWRASIGEIWWRSQWELEEVWGKQEYQDALDASNLDSKQYIQKSKVEPGQLEKLWNQKK